MKFAFRKTCLLLALISTSLLGCSRSTEPEVVVYVSVDRANAEPILDDFQSETGIRVRAVYDAEATKTTGLVSRLLAESERPRCDVFWNNELLQTMMLADRGLLESYKPASAESGPAQFGDDRNRWTPLAARARVIAFNTELVDAEDVPRTLAELADPRWKATVAMANPGFGTTRTHVAALFAALGEQRAANLMQSWLDNGIQVLDGNAMVKNRIGRAVLGASPILVGLTDTDDVRAGQAEGFPIDMVFPDQNDFGTLVTPTTICLIRGAPHAEQARMLVDYLASPEVETRLTSHDSGYLPLRTGGSNASPKAMAFSHDELLKQLTPSSQWIAEHFR